VYGYWLGLAAALIAVVLRALAAVGIWIRAVQPGSAPISYNTFYHGAELLFLLAIAATCGAWAKGQKG